MNRSKIVIAVDSFKGCLSSEEVAETIEYYLAETYSNIEIVKVPISDGGEGLIKALFQSEYKTVSLTVLDPLMRPIEGEYLIAKDGKCAIIELASAAGLALLSESERNPLKTTTYGVGEMIVDAMSKGCRHILLGIGGSATNDAAIGILQALGFRFLNKNGIPLTPCGESLGQIASIDCTNANPLLKETLFEIACDVKNPFYGENGAAYIYSPQKGANDQMVHQLDQGLRHFSELITQSFGIDIQQISGSGAAGGVGGGIVAMLNATIKPGIELILNYMKFDERIQNASLIITGEGKMDKQTLMGKAPYGILETGIKNNIPVLALAGQINDISELKKAGFKELYEVSPPNIPLKVSMRKDIAKQNIKNTLQKVNFQQYL